MKSFFFCIYSCLLFSLSFGQKMEAVYQNNKDSSANYYIAVLPESGTPKAMLVLMPGAFQAPEHVLQQTDLPFSAARQGVITIIPSLEQGIYAFGIDSASQQSLHRHISHAFDKYALKEKRFFIGGFSLGGSAAVKYAELAGYGNRQDWPAPQAVFAIDPPLDFERYYNAASRIVRLSPPGQVNQEISYMMQKIRQEMKGTPQTALDNFYNMSPYSYSDEQQTAVRTLVHTPVMIITEPDIDWWLRERGYDYSFMNSTDQAAFINELQRLGNQNAVLVTTRDKGYRLPAHIRHPHSFSIIDQEQLLRWLSSFKETRK